MCACGPIRLHRFGWRRPEENGRYSTGDVGLSATMQGWRCGGELRHHRVRHRRSALLACEVLEPPPRRIEGVVNGGASVSTLAVDLRILRKRRLVNVLRSSVQGRIVADDDWRPACDGEFNPDMEVPTAAAMPVRHLDEHAAGRGDSIAIARSFVGRRRRPRRALFMRASLRNIPPGRGKIVNRAPAHRPKMRQRAENTAA